MPREGSLSLDLDNKWSYMRAQGIQGWEKFPSYLPQVVPRILEIMSTLELSLTVFVVGCDAEVEENIPWIKEIVTAGHDIGNHSYVHDPLIHEQPLQAIVSDIRNAERAIQSATGQKTIAFRGPGFAVSKTLLNVLQDLGYLYDASVFPTFLAPLIKRVSRRDRTLSQGQKPQKKASFGKVSDGFRCLGPHFWQVNTGKLLEIPVTTMPVFRIPIHFTYLHFLAQKSRGLAMLYFKVSLVLCHVFRVEPSILLHPLDFLGADLVPELKKFPGMGRSTAEKCELTVIFLKELQKRYKLLPLSEYAAGACRRASLKTIAL